MKHIILLITALLLCSQLHGQIDPLVEIQGKLSIYLPDDTTSVHIGKNADRTQILTSGQNNTLIGTNAGRKITDGVDNSFFGTNSGLNNQGGGQNSFFGSNAGRDNDGTYNGFFGANAGLKNINGTENSFFGQGAGRDNTDNNGNSFSDTRQDHIIAKVHLTASSEETQVIIMNPDPITVSLEINQAIQIPMDTAICFLAMGVAIAIMESATVFLV